MRYTTTQGGAAEAGDREEKKPTTPAATRLATRIALRILLIGVLLRYEG
jgi:hypothetical protein